MLGLAARSVLAPDPPPAPIRPRYLPWPPGGVGASLRLSDGPQEVVSPSTSASYLRIHFQGHILAAGDLLVNDYAEKYIYNELRSSIKAETRRDERLAERGRKREAREIRDMKPMRGADREERERKEEEKGDEDGEAGRERKTASQLHRKVACL